ncbi:MarR family winged helix-turn-helix transcriptional regulator [Roseateles sp.]|uniref:MarR family winged helix-turn-helix transcriptional regulator n=1 Tax=Roseateles sp. TaxID=1971397 RepID=UPI0039EC589E
MSNKVDIVNNKAGNASTAAEVFETIHTLMHLFRGQQFRALRDGPTAITHMEAKALAFFARHPGATPSELVARSGRDKAQIARLIAGLKERGLLLAEVDPSDRRVQRLHLSPESAKAQEAVRVQGDRLAKAAMRGLSATECEQLLELLARVRANLDADG